jgi:hypothetical protein
MARVNGVVSSYVQMDNELQDSGLHALLVSGARGLGTNEECWEAVRMIEERTGNSVLPEDLVALGNIDLKSFLSELRVEGPQIPNYLSVLKSFKKG